MNSPRSRIVRRMLVASVMLAALAGAGYVLAQAPSTPPDSATSTPPASTPPATTPPATTPPAEAAPAQTAPAATPAAAAAPAPAERIAALKASIQKDNAALKHYQWVETTTMSLKGEVKSTKQNNCYYGADGKLTKVPVGAEAEAKKKRGVRGKVIENKTEEITAYMTKAAAAIKTYIPPKPAKLQASKDAGKATYTMLDPNKRARFDFKDYNVAGDLLGIDVDLVNNKLLGLNVTTMVEGGKEPVMFVSQYGSLEDGTGYPMKTTLDAKEMGVTIVVENSGYKPAAK